MRPWRVTVTWHLVRSIYYLLRFWKRSTKLHFYVSLSGVGAPTFFFLKQASTFYKCQSVWWFDLILFHFFWKTFIQYKHATESNPFQMFKKRFLILHANKTRSKFGTCSFRWLLLGPEVGNIPLFHVRNCSFLHLFFSFSERVLESGYCIFGWDLA